MNFLASLLLRLLPYLLGLAPDAWAAFKPVLLSSSKSFVSDAVAVALPLVRSFEYSPLHSDLSGADKRAQVIAGIQAVFAKNGKTLAQSTASFAVELALQQVRLVVSTVPPISNSLSLNSQMEFDAGANIAKRGDQLLDGASECAKAGFDSVHPLERGQYDANGKLHPPGTKISQ